MQDATFIEIIADFNRLSALLQEKVHDALVQQRLARRAAYQMASNYCQMLKAHHGALLDYIRSEGFSGSNLVDQFIEARFGVIDRLVSDGHRAIIRAVQEGMTQKEFLASSALVFIGHRKASAKVNALVDAEPPAAPPESAPIETRLECALATVNAQTSQIKELKKELRQARQHAARLEVQVNRLIRLGDESKRVKEAVTC